MKKGTIEAHNIDGSKVKGVQSEGWCNGSGLLIDLPDDVVIIDDRYTLIDNCPFNCKATNLTVIVRKT